MRALPHAPPFQSFRPLNSLVAMASSARSFFRSQLLIRLRSSVLGMLQQHASHVTPALTRKGAACHYVSRS